jgi:hypothetical protein
VIYLAVKVAPRRPTTIEVPKDHPAVRNVQNITISYEGNYLVLGVDTSKTFGGSDSGKSTRIATTRNDVLLPLRKEKISVSLNVFKYQDSRAIPRRYEVQRMQFPIHMGNIEVNVKGSRLTFRVPLDERLLEVEPQISSDGKRMIIATTGSRARRVSPHPKQIHAILSVYRPIEPNEQLSLGI